MEIVRISEYTV